MSLVKPPPPPPSNASENVLERNIAALIARRRRDDEAKTLQDRLADAISRFTGSMRFVYLHVAFFGMWIFVNLPGVPLPKFDPSFVVLAMVASVEAIFLSTFVLITQNRQAVLADKRAELDLQISLLSEHEITRVITLLSAVGEKLKVAEARDPSLTPLKEDVAPEHVLDRLDAADDRK